MKLKGIVIALIVVLISCAVEENADLDNALMERISGSIPSGNARDFILADEYDYANYPNQDPHNPITKEKVDLGRLLYFEPGLAQNPKDPVGFETYSCATCHIPEAAFLPGRLQGVADGGMGFGINGHRRIKQLNYKEDELDAQGTRPLSTLNVTYMTNTLWSGLFGANDVNIGTEEGWVGLAEVNHTGFVGLEAQNIEGFDLHRLEINDKVLDVFGYRALFDAAFPDYPIEDRYSRETASFAISAYARSLITTDAPFQDYLKGNRHAITDNQKKGALIFFGKGRCVTCHDGPAFSSMHFYALGTSDMFEHGGLNTSKEDPRNWGRALLTLKEEDKYKFKVPQLYNLKDYTHFFHGSSKTSLWEVIDYKIKAKSENSLVSDDRLAEEFNKLYMTREDKGLLADFLLNALYDGNVQRFVPDTVLSGYCFPNNDWLSIQDNGCL